MTASKYHVFLLVWPLLETAMGTLCIGGRQCRLLFVVVLTSTHVHNRVYVATVQAFKTRADEYPGEKNVVESKNTKISQIHTITEIHRTPINRNKSKQRTYAPDAYLARVAT